MRRHLNTCGMFLLLPVLLTSGAQAQQGRLKGLDAYITRAIADWQVPGLALAIVHRDSLVHAAGYGVRELGKPDRVDARTLFAIGSASKAFTAATLATLVDEGKAKWDDAVTTHLSGFQLFDPYVTRELTLRDLVSHRSGLARGDRVWYGTENDREDVVRLVRHLRPTWSLRSQFGYQNILYVAAGEVAEAISGKSWDALVDERLFEPLGMTESITSIAPLSTKSNVATPHAKIDEQVQPIRWRNIDNVAPAGSINSNVVEMVQWVRMHLGEGKYGGRQVLSDRNVREMQSPHTIIAIDTTSERFYPETHFRSYGLGWFLEDYRGRKLVYHGGNIDGMSALVALMSEEKVGLVILTNMNGTGLPNALMRRICDLYLGGPGRDWSAESLALTKEREARAAEQQRKTLEAQVKGTSPSLALEGYTGTFEDPMYGRVKVMLEEGALRLDAGPAFVANLEHWHFNTFRATWRDRLLGRGFVKYDLNLQGKADVLNIEGLADFHRVPEPAAASTDSRR